MTLVIFDIDGTLLYSDRRDSRSFAEAYERIYQRPFPSLDWRTFPHVTDTTIFDTVIQQHFNRPSTESERLAFLEEYVGLLRHNRRRTPHHFQAVRGARQAMAALLSSSGHVVGIATGGWRQPAEVKLEHVGITVDRRLFSGADGKVNREAIIEEVLHKARELHGSVPSRIVYIGDAEWDVKTTRNLQIGFIGIRHRGDHEVLSSIGARHVIQDYEDYPRFLSLLEKAEPPSPPESL